MSISHLQKITKKAKKRLGMGHGSGRSKTAGRGTKGQNARTTVPMTKLYYSGGSLAFVKSLPFLRGKNKNNSFTKESVVLNVGDLQKLAKGTVADVASLAAAKLVKASEVKKKGLKILGDGELTIALTVKVPVSAGAKEKIEKAGGTIA